jgi:hypothetical protein
LNCRKPLFQRGQNPFYELDSSSDSLKGKKVNTVAKLKENAERKFLLEGNAKLLTEYF